jgi:hypothetical protein
VAVISNEPISVGLDLLIFPAEIFIEESVLLSFKGYFSISILANLIESEVILLAKSVSGIDALTPEAFGISRFTPEAIWDEMYFSRPITPAKRDKTSTDVAIILIFISGTYQRKLAIFMDSGLPACEFGQKSRVVHI